MNLFGCGRLGIFGENFSKPFLTGCGVIEGTCKLTIVELRGSGMFAQRASKQEHLMGV